MCEELKDNFQSVFTVETLITPTPVRWGGEEDLENIETDKHTISRLLKGLDPYKPHGPDEVSPHGLKECAATICWTLEMFKENSLEGGLLPSEWKQIVPFLKREGWDVH